MRNSAAYVGRVGGLAVALGIGAAVTIGNGVALADTTDGASGATSSGTSESKSETPDAAPSAAQAGSTAPGQGVGPGNSEIVRSGGGAQTSSNPSNSVTTTSDDPPASTPTVAGEAGITEPVDTNPTDTEPAASGQVTGTPATGQLGTELTESLEPAPPSARHSNPTSHVPEQGDGKSAWKIEARLPATASGTASNEVRPAVDAETSIAAAAQAVESNLVRATGTQEKTVATLSTADSESVMALAAPAPPATTATLPDIVAGVLAAFGFGPLATNSPVAPAAPQTMLLGLLEWVRREISRTFFNQTPTIAYNPAENSLVNGSIVGKLTAVDPDSTDFTFTASKPAHGEVTVDPDGTFTYTPGATYSGYDTFEVTVSDASSGFHIHGPSGLLNLVTFGLLGDSGDTSTRTITIGEAPSGGYTVTTVVSGLSQPTDFRFLPDGRILFAEKGGAIKVSDQNGQLQSTPLITLPTNTVWARGLVAVEVDPDYQENGYLYASYVTSDNYQRLSRLTVTDPTAEVLTIDPDSEVVLVQGTQPAGNDHHGGGLSFGPDGMLYWSTGDNVCCSVIDGSNSQNLTNMYGKVLRLNPDGTAPSDNPFYDGDGPNYDAIYATGFRNPFRLTFTPDGKLFVVDVGQSAWEEVNLVTAGANYGWPNAEGPCNGIGTTSCSTPSSYANPIYAYPHTTGGSSITAVMAYTGSTAGSSQNTVLIADFNQGWIKELTFNSDYSSLISERFFDDAAPGATNKLVQTPDGNIYQLTFDGKLTRISPSSDVVSTV
jgi:aldose sugar dehydrogenase